MPHSLCIGEIIDSKRRCYLNVKKVLFQNTLQQSTCCKVPNTAEICTAPLLSYSLIIPRIIELENASLSQISNLIPFVNTLTAHNKYSGNISGNFLQTIQIQVSKKPNIWLNFTFFEHFPKNDEPYSLSICKTIGSETRGYRNVKKVLFQKIPTQSTYAGSQRINGSQAHLKFPLQKFYPIASSFLHQFSWETSLLVRYETLGLFVNLLTAISRNQFKWNYLRNQKLLCQIFIAFLKVI